MVFEKRYEIDGVHFDDYFYPYPGEDPLPDKDTYEKYGADRFDSIEDWRRDNVDLLIKELNEAIHAEKPWVKFGISPFAIWRNKKEDDRGSETNGFSSYSGLYADVYKWGQEGWMDYVNPQDRKSTRLNSSHVAISYAVFCLKKKIIKVYCRST